MARCGNISRAAKELYISQPAISKAIGKLEESLGTRLFLRNSRGVQLTPEGNVLFQHVAAAFDSLSRGEKELKRIHDFHIGQLKIGVSNTLCKYVLLPYLKSFVEKYPHVNITIESQSTAHTLEMLEARKIDIGLVAEPRARRGLNFTPVMEIHDGFVCTPAYMENLTLREITVDKNHRCKGKTLEQVEIPQGMLIIMVQRGGQTIIPRGDTLIEEGDMLVAAQF